MCDPVSMTLAASSAMSTAGGYLAGTSMLSGVGVGMINAASAINSSSAFVQGLRGVSLAMNVGNTLSAAGRIYGGSLQQQYNNRQAELEQQKYVEQQKQMKAQIERDKLEARSQELDRRRTYIRNAASNQSQMAVSGVTMASASYSALLDSNKDTYFRDINYIKMLGKERDYVNKTELEQSNIAQRSAQKQYKTLAKSTTVNTLLDASKMYFG
jgi:hypothetical protein